MTPHAPYPAPQPLWRRVGRSSAFKIFLVVYLVVQILLITDLETASTVLYTPLSLAVIHFAEWLGAGTTMAAGALILFDAISSATKRRWGLVFIGLVLLGPFAAASAVFFGHFAWRAEEAIAFWHYRGDAHTWNMRVAGLQLVGRGNNPVAEIRRWRGDPLSFPLSRADFERFPDRHLRNLDICYPVQYQQSGAAIRIWRPDEPAFGELRLEPCPPRTRSHRL